MLTGRSVIIAVVAVVVTSLTVATVSLFQPQDRGGLGTDTYGTQPHGYRAIFDILRELDIAVDRAVVPPTESLHQPVTIVLWGPLGDLVNSEPTYLRHMGQWVRRGGRVVVAPERRDPLKRLRSNASRSPVKETSAVEELGLPRIGTRIVNLADADESSPAEDKETDEEPTYRNELPPDFAGRVREAFLPTLAPTRQVDVAAEGDLAPMANEVTTLEVPERVQTLDVGETEPSGRITIRRDKDQPLVIAACYPLDKGKVIVVGDPDLFENRLIAKADNSVLAVRLLDDAGRTVLWDEFYHGLTIRGQPLFLLTRGPYAILAFLCVAATAVWVWRSAIFLGPPLPTAVAMRRSLAEYVEAMARFFNRGRESRRFVLGEVRAGVLWAMRKKLGLPPGEESPQNLAAALARHDPAAARRLLDAVAAVDLTLSEHARLADRRTLQLLKGLNDCL
jgi:hypothetical protein